MDPSFCQFISFLAGGVIVIFTHFATEEETYSWSKPHTEQQRARYKIYRRLSIGAWVFLGMPGAIRVISAAWMGVVL